MSEPTKWTPQQQIDSLAEQLHAERESRKRERDTASETIQMTEDDFCEVMETLRLAGLLMAHDARTKTDDERWAIFSRAIHIVMKYDARFQPANPATNADYGLVK
jgi:hypothetical protein